MLQLKMQAKIMQWPKVAMQSPFNTVFYVTFQENTTKQDQLQQKF